MNVYDKYSNPLNKLKYFLNVVYILNITDLIFTKLLLKYGNGLFKEANPFLAPIINTNIVTFSKVIFLAITFIYWYKRSFKSNAKQLAASLLVAKIFIVVYSLINLLHIFYLGLYLYLENLFR